MTQERRDELDEIVKNVILVSDIYDKDQAAATLIQACHLQTAIAACALHCLKYKISMLMRRNAGYRVLPISIDGLLRLLLS